MMQSPERPLKSALDFYEGVVKHLRSLQQMVEPAPKTSQNGSAQSKEAMPRKKAKPRNYVGMVLPLLQARGALHIKELLEFVRSRPGYNLTRRESFESTLQGEVKKRYPRLSHVGPGMYAAIVPASSDGKDVELRAKAA